MAAIGDFVPPEDGDYIDEPMNPVVFGVEFTPTIIGILVALAGIGGAAYLFVNKVQPVAVQNEALRTDISTKEGQLISQAQQLEDIAKIEAELEVAMQRRRNVYGLFANEKTMDTLLLDINQRIENSNAALAGVKNQVRSRGIPAVVLEAQLKSFSPGEKVVVSDSSLGAEINGKLRREVYSIRFSGDYAQTQNILRNLERLEPLLMVRDFSVSRGQVVEETIIGSDGQVIREPKAKLETSFQLDALMPTADADVPPEVAPPAEGG
ncbi:MAG: hypothetical protein AAFN12_07905 [Cyanobacteria bacterium J06560_2]